MVQNENQNENQNESKWMWLWLLIDKCHSHFLPTNEVVIDIVSTVIGYVRDAANQNFADSNAIDTFNKNVLLDETKLYPGWLQFEYISAEERIHWITFASEFHLYFKDTIGAWTLFCYTSF